MPDDPEKPKKPDDSHGASIGRLLREAMGSATALAKSEAELARIELLHNIRDAGRQSLKLALAALLLLLGAVTLLTALVIALGSFMGEHYGLSCLIVGSILILSSAWIATRALRSISDDTNLPLARMNLRDDETLFRQNIVDISDRLKNRGEPQGD